MSRRRRAALAAAPVVLGLVAGCSLAGGPDPKDQARAVADQAAGLIAQGKVPTSVTGTDATVAQTALTAALEGMGSIPHQVKVGDVTVAEDGRSGAATLDHTWTVRPGAKPWTYRTTLPLVRSEETWRTTWSPDVVAPGLAAGQRIGATRLPAARGDILGEGGEPIVTDRRVARIGIDRAHTASVAEAKASAATLARLVGVDPAAFTAAVEAAGPQAFVEAITYRDPSPDLAKVTPRLAGITGAAAVEGTMALAPTSTFAAPLLGRVGPATKEIVDASKGAVRAGDVVGLSGLQAGQDARLAGTPGYVVQAFTADPKAAPRDLFRVEASDGSDVTTTLSLRHQEAAERALAQVAPASAVVAVRPSDGHVLAAASGPGSKGYSTATLGQYAPGSTFKTITALALLRAGATPATPLDCTPTLTVDGRTFTNYDDYPASALGRIPLAKAVATSCNTAFIAARDTLSPTGLAEAAAAVGLTAAPALGVPAALGTVPATTGGTDHAAAMIGQGRIVASPLGMATAAASFVAGTPVRPVLVPPAQPAPGGGTASGTSAAATAPVTTAAAPAKPVTAPEAESVRALMRGVVTEGSAPFLRTVPGGPVVAKTGTAEYGNDTPPKTHAWMIAAQGDLAVAVFVEDGAGGATTAGPILTRFLTDVAKG